MTDLTEFLLARIAEDEDSHEDHWQTPHGWRRLLAECEAKRRIVELHAVVPVGPPTPYRYVDVDACATCGTSSEYPEPWPCGTLRALAAIYVDHPDYRDEWRP